jgi:hypothetical protein
MAIDAEMLAAALAAGTRLADAERTAELARADFHHAVRRVHLAGGSLSEIADALGLSYERVHQIAEGAGGSWSSPPRAFPGNMLECSFCGKCPRSSRSARTSPGPSAASAASAAIKCQAWRWPQEGRSAASA